jgi:RNA polymerase sigma factor (sigma-70 family)
MEESSQEDSWVRRLTSDDHSERDAAITELRELLLRALARTLTERYGPQLQLEDVVQDATIKILNSLDQFSGRSQFITWAITIATRFGLTELRRRRYLDVSLDGDEAESLVEALSDDNSTAADQIEKTQILTTLNEIIRSDLTDKQQRAIHATLDGLPVQEIATRLGSNRNAIYKLVHDARTRLRDGLERRGITADDISIITA